MAATVSRASESFARELPDHRSEDPRAKLGALARLWEEAEETARLANLLGRAPFAAAALGVGAVATTILSSPAGPARLIAWLVLVMAAIAAISRVCWQTMRAPFERGPLRAFEKDFDAIMFYAGFAWGGGSILLLPADAPLSTLALFGAGLPAALFAILKSRKPALSFFAPAAGLTGLSALVGQHAGGVPLAGSVLAASAAISFTIFARERRGKVRIPSLPLP